VKYGQTDLIRPAVRALGAYPAPQAGELIKLSTMENPYRWPEQLVDKWLEKLRVVHINRYPSADAGALKDALRTYYDIDSETPMLLGNGSDELIQLLLLALGSTSSTVLAPSPTFVMYRHSSIATGSDYISVPLAASDFRLSHNLMLDAIERHQPAITFISYPNNPTGNLFERTVVDDIIGAAKGLVVLDEAYAPFAKSTYLDQLDKHPNLLVMRTLSKVGFAGLRLGVLFGAPQWLHEFEKLRLPYNINSLSQVSAQFALEHREIFDEQTRQICADREILMQGLSALDGIETFPTAANFILLRTQEGQALRIYTELQTHGVLVKNLHGSDPLLRDCLRVSVGTPTENRVFLTGLAKVL
jgi:histidinol-phosphate aminotransferase